MNAFNDSFLKINLSSEGYIFQYKNKIKKILVWFYF